MDRSLFISGQEGHTRNASEVDTRGSSETKSQVGDGGDRVSEHQLCMLTSDSLMIPTRVCNLLAARKISVDSVQMTKLAGSSRWWIQLVVRVAEPDDVELLVKRLNRLIDVIKVIDITAGPNHQRPSVFVKFRPDPTRPTSYISAAADRSQRAGLK